MATYYWVGGTGIWSATTNWASSSGGAGNAGVPTATDNVIIDTNSSTGTITVASGACLDLTVTATQAITLGALTSTLSVYGNLTFPSGGSFVGMTAGTITFAATATGKTITTNSKTIGTVVFNGVGGGWTLQDAFTTASTATITLTAGTLNTNGQAVNTTSFIISGTTTRTLTLGASTVTLSSTTAPWTATTTTALTFNANTSTIVISAAISSGGQMTIACGGLTYNNFTFSNTGSGPAFGYAISGDNTFTALTFATRTAASMLLVYFSGNQTIGTLTVNGTYTGRTQLASNTIGTARTFTITTRSVNYADFRDITIAGTTLTGTSFGDCGGNSNITFDTTKTVYWNLAGAQNWSATGWATSSGGTPAVANFPLAQDTAIFDDTGSVTGTITIPTTYNIGTLNITKTSAMTLATGLVTNQNVCGNWTCGALTTFTGVGTLNFIGRGITQTITSNGRTFTQSIYADTFSGTVVLADTFNGANFYAGSGSFSTNNFNMSISYLQAVINSPSVIDFGTSTISMTGTGSLALVLGSATFKFASCTIDLTNTSTSARSFDGGSATYGTINIGGATSTSTTTFGTGSMTIRKLSTTKTVAHTIRFSGNQTVNNWAITGTAGNIVTVNSSTVGTQRTLTYTGGTAGGRIVMDYMSITDIGFSYTLGGANPILAYAGANSTNGGNNSGIAFIAGTTQTAYILTSGTTWTVPVNWNSSNNTVYMIGAGGGGAASAVSGDNRAAGGGGGGGGYTVLTNQSLTPAASIPYTIGTSLSDTNGGSTTFNTTNTAGGGSKGTATTTPTSAGGAGGAGVTSNGGAGGAGAFGTVASSAYGAGGGGGAGGPSGTGGTGGVGFGSTTQSLIAGGGGGGNGGGSAGGNGSSGLGGGGGNNFNGLGGGVGTSGAATSGTVGGGGGGGANNFQGASGGSGIDIANTIGGAGGRGGGGVTTSATNTGLYGGGGSGGGMGTIGQALGGAAGSQGVIFIVYAQLAGGITVPSGVTITGGITVTP